MLGLGVWVWLVICDLLVVLVYFGVLGYLIFVLFVCCRVYWFTSDDLTCCGPLRVLFGVCDLGLGCC